MHNFRIAKLLLCLLGAASWSAAFADQDNDIEAKVAALLARMTLEQKVGQMVQPDIRSVTPDDVRKHRLGSVLNGGGAFPGENKHASVADWVALADRFYDASMDTTNGALAIPIIWGTDAVHGHNNVIGATLFPHNIGLGAANDPDLMERIGAATAREVAATGLDWTFAPVVAVVRDDRWGRTYESYSEDPQIVRTYADRFVRGLQGAPGSREFLDSSHVFATAKHFIGDGGTADGVDRGDTVSSESDLLRIHGPGYVAAIAAGVQTVMVSYNSWNGLKVHGHQHLITDVLKKSMGFDGIVVSDWDGVDEVQGCSKDKCAQAINAGIDMVMVPTDWRNFLTNTLDQVRKEKIPMARIDDAVTRILRVKFRAGLFEQRPPFVAAARQQARAGGCAGASRAGAAGGAQIAGAAQERARAAAAAAQVARARRRRWRRQHFQAERRLDTDVAGHRELEGRFPRRDVDPARHRAYGRGGGRQSDVRVVDGHLRRFAAGRCGRGVRRRPVCRVVRRPAVDRLPAVPAAPSSRCCSNCGRRPCRPPACSSPAGRCGSSRSWPRATRSSWPGCRAARAAASPTCCSAKPTAR